MSRLVLGIRCVLLGMMLNAIVVRLGSHPPNPKHIHFPILIGLGVLISIIATELLEKRGR
jgi:hypothetical protein